MWRLLARLCDEPLPCDYESKKAMLARHHIVLWDFYDSVVRSDSSDKGIRAGEPNDVPGFLADNPTISVVAVNGYGKYKAFGKMLQEICDEYLADRKIKVLRLPETSGLNASWNMDRLYDDWKSIFE